MFGYCNMRVLVCCWFFNVCVCVCFVFVKCACVYVVGSLMCEYV